MICFYEIKRVALYVRLFLFIGAVVQFIYYSLITITMEPQNISSFIAERVRAGVSKGDIKEQLSAVGWSDDEIDAAYAEALVKSGVPVPDKGARGAYAKKASAVEVVLNLFSFILLGIIVTALGILYFNIIDYFFPDSLRYNDMYTAEAMRAGIHYAMAALIIGFPLYFFAVRMWFQKFREDEGKVESKLTKWITYLVLLVASVTIVGDLIAVLNTFLQGEITARFFLKGLTILAIAGSVFSFYFLERKRIQYRQPIERKTFQMFAWSLLGIIIVGIMLGFIAGGTPSLERQRTFDTQRSNDLQQLAQCVTSYAQMFEGLPSSLDELSRTTDLSYCGSNIYDPESGEVYEYNVLVPLSMSGNGMFTGSFQLCATFALSTQDTVKTTYLDPNTKWFTHPVGRYCDTESVSFRPNSNTLKVPPPVVTSF